MSTLPMVRSSQRVTGLEAIAWCMVAAAILLAHVHLTHGPILRNDSYQYLSAADNFLAGWPGFSAIAHFDAERSYGHLPAPLTTFPVGYPAAISAIALFGSSTTAGGLMLSIAACLALLPICIYLANAFSLGAAATRLMVLWLIGNSWFAFYGTLVTAEALFTLTTTAALALYVAALVREESDRRVTVLFAAGGVLVGVSYWIRYAGLFLYAAIALFFAIGLIAGNRRRARRAVPSLVIASAIVSAGLVRNELLVHTWKGGNTKVVHHPIKQVLHEFVIWMHHLLLGGIASARFGVLESIFLLGALVVALALLAGVRATRLAGAIVHGGSDSPLALLALYLGVYCAGMIYLGITSVISFDTRMFYPILPVILTLGAICCKPLASAGLAPSMRQAAWAGVAAMTIAYLGINVRSFVQPVPASPDELTARDLGGEVAPGTTMRAWLLANVPAGQAIVATRGQASEYLLHRNTVSLVSNEYSDTRWDEHAIRTLMRTYDAHFLLLYVNRDSDPVLRESPFLSALAAGRIPGWLAVAAHNHRAAVFEMKPK